MPKNATSTPSIKSVASENYGKFQHHSGTFISESETNITSIVATDINGDSSIDLIIGNYVQSNYLLLNNGNGTSYSKKCLLTVLLHKQPYKL